MKGILISESEKQRILEMHQNAASTQYLNEVTGPSGDMMVHSQLAGSDAIYIRGIFKPNQVQSYLGAVIWNFSDKSPAIVSQGVVSMTPEGTALGLTPQQFKLTQFPLQVPKLSEYEVENPRHVGPDIKRQQRPYKISQQNGMGNLYFTTPSKRMRVTTETHVANITYTTNDSTQKNQVIKIFISKNTEFGVEGGVKN